MAKKKTTSTTAKKARRASGTTARANVIEEPAAPATELLKHSHRILCDGIKSVNSLASMYRKAQIDRGGGAPSHSEQDLLRAMVVMAGATLDATLKRLIRDALSDLASHRNEARVEAQKHVKRRLLADLEKRGGDRLAQILLSDAPRDQLMEFIVEDATGDSLQSDAEVQKVVKLLGLAPMNQDGLRAAFETRNQIIHEMDVRPEERGRGITRRRQRRQGAMYDHAKDLLTSASQILIKADQALSS